MTEKAPWHSRIEEIRAASEKALYIKKLLTEDLVRRKKVITGTDFNVVGDILF